MKVIYKGKLIETDEDTIDSKPIITESNYDKHESRKIHDTWKAVESRQRREHGIGNDRVIENPTSVLWEDNHLI